MLLFLLLSLLLWSIPMRAKPLNLPLHIGGLQLMALDLEAKEQDEMLLQRNKQGQKLKLLSYSVPRLVPNPDGVAEPMAVSPVASSPRYHPSQFDSLFES